MGMYSPTNNYSVPLFVLQKVIDRRELCRSQPGHDELMMMRGESPSPTLLSVCCHPSPLVEENNAELCSFCFLSSRFSFVFVNVLAGVFVWVMVLQLLV